jgi:adenine phosphoribosyltransferase
LIRDIPDYPKPGILFKDITPLLADAEAFAMATRLMVEPFAEAGVTHVVAIESRGFILGAPVAQLLGAGFVPVRKPGKLPHTKRREEYALEYGTDALEVHEDAVGSTALVLIVDDVLATGGTAAATCRLVESLGAQVVGLSFLLALTFLPGAERLRGRRVSSILDF